MLTEVAMDDFTIGHTKDLPLGLSLVSKLYNFSTLLGKLNACTWLRSITINLQ